MSSGKFLEIIARRIFPHEPLVYYTRSRPPLQKHSYLQLSSQGKKTKKAGSLGVTLGNEGEKASAIRRAILGEFLLKSSNACTFCALHRVRKDKPSAGMN